MRLTSGGKRPETLFLLAVLLLAACNLGQSGPTGSGSSPAGDVGRGSGPCKNVAICTLIPLSQVNSSLGVTASNAVPDEPINSGGLTSDNCAYLNAASSTNVKLLRLCNEAGMVPETYQQAHQEYLAPGGTRTDLSGVGEKAFYETIPGQTAPKVRLVAFKGNVYVILSDAHVGPGQDAMVKQGLVSFANTLLAAQ